MSETQVLWEHPETLPLEAGQEPENGRQTQASPLPDRDLPDGAYAHNDEHLWDELRRVDLLVRAQTVRWRWMVAATKPQHLWGMVHVTDAEVQAYLQAPFAPASHLPGELEQALAPYWDAADELSHAIQERLAATPPSIPLRLAWLQELYNLSDLERDVLLVCLLPQMDARYRRLFGYLLDDASRTQPTVELLLQILHPLISHPALGRAVFDADGPLLAHHLLALSSLVPGDETLPMRSVRLDERIVGFLLGHDRLDARLVGLVTAAQGALSWNELILDDRRLARLQALAAWWVARCQEGWPGATLLLHGPYGSGRQAAARAMCTATETPLLFVDVARAQGTAENWERIVDLTYREATLRQAAVYWAGCELLLKGQEPAHQAAHLLQRWEVVLAAAERFQGLTFLASEIAWDPAGRFHRHPFLRLDFPMPDYPTRRRLWEAHLPPPDAFAAPAPDRSALSELLANGFQFTAGQVVDVLATAWGLATQREPEAPRLTVEDLYAGCRRQSGRKLMTMARRIEPRTELTFEDLILPPPNRRQLEELRARVRHHSRVYSGLGFERRLSLGQGLIALFTGSSGTGKTMAAELLAREQGVDLYKVDLSAVVSKYVGETEKNLSKVFAEAEDTNAIIFFDEADALFGKRGEVREARDRWANIEVNYLLQRVEEYAGVVIMASNLRQNIDEAFLRRIHVVVEFPFPDAEARFQILCGMFPASLDRPQDPELYPLADRFRLAGGSLKNIVLDAAFRALATAEPGGTPVITLRHLIAATGREHQKLGKPLTKGAFGETFYDWLKEDIL